MSKFPGFRLVIAGLVTAWLASIGLALQLKTLLTPGNYPIGTDPSFDISAAIFFLLLFLLGGLLFWRGLIEKDRFVDSARTRILNGFLIVDSLFLALVLVVTFLLYSANAAFLRQYVPIFVDKQKPDYSYPSFPTPVDLQPTPVYDPRSISLSGPILSSLDGLRAGQISIELTSDSTQIETILIDLDRINCDVQAAGKVTTYAVALSKTLLRGPIQLQDGEFYVTQSGAAMHGIVTDNGQGHGTIYLQYSDAASHQTCDLGNFDWSVAIISH